MAKHLADLRLQRSLRVSAKKPQHRREHNDHEGLIPGDIEFIERVKPDERTERVEEAPERVTDNTL